MTEQEIRLRCLELAIKIVGENGEVVAKAEELLAFINRPLRASP